MTLAAEQTKAGKRIVYFVGIELKYQIETRAWTQCNAPNTAVWWMDHLAERAPSRVRECDRTTHLIVEYTPKASIAECQATAKTQFYDSATGRLYVQTTNGDSPAAAGAYYLSSHFWERVTTQQLRAPYEFVLDGKWPEPRLDESSIPGVSQTVAPFSEGGVRQSFGSVKIQNADKHYDSWLDIYGGHYIWSACPIILWSGPRAIVGPRSRRR